MMFPSLIAKLLHYRSTGLSKSTWTACCQKWKTKLQKRSLSTSQRESLKPYFITTPIFYVNAVPHIGHLYTAVLADTVARWHRVKGHQVIYSTGTDEHGMKIQKAAFSNKEEPNAHCDKISKQFERLFTAAGLSNTDFIRTTEDRHINTVQHFWSRLYERGHIYKGSYAGWYCTSDEAFLTDDQVTEVTDKLGQVTKISAESGQPVEWLEEDNYVFRLSAFKDQLLAWLDTGVIKPDKFSSVVSRWVEENLQDLSVSRSRQRLGWGIPVPGDPTQTIYVWLDALVNYLTVGGYPQPGYTWPADCQVVGKDILKFHAVYWPAFLMAAGLEPPRSILCHSHWLVDGVKMSKSLQNVVDPFMSMERFTVDGLRYFLVREAVPHSDANYSTEKVINILNSELANTLGNLLGRCTSKTICPQQKFPTFDMDLFRDTASSDDSQMWNDLQDLSSLVDDHYSDYDIYKGIGAIMAQLRHTNVFFDKYKPWELCKDDDKTKLLGNVNYISMETLRTCAILLQPVMPDISTRILDQLNIPNESRTFQDVQQRFGGDHDLNENFGAIFQRIKHKH